MEVATLITLILLARELHLDIGMAIALSLA